MKDYKKILEGVVNIINTTEKSDIGFANICAYIGDNCPKLKESKDEKIRKCISLCLEECMYKDIIRDYERDECLAWLEKQGERKRFIDHIQIGDKVTRNKNGVLVNLSQLARMAKQGKKGTKGNEREIPNSEQKPTGKVEPKFKVGDNIISTLSNNPYYITGVCNGYYLTDIGCIIMFNAQDNFELVEQKSAENKGMNLVEEEMTPFQKKVFCIVDTAIEEEQGLSNICNELLALAKQDVEYKSAWSEKDEIGLGEALWAIQQARTIAKDENDMGNLWYAEKWLKSLKERYSWKPSDEQMKQLGWVAEQNKDNMIGKELMSLYQDLKKLKD